MRELTGTRMRRTKSRTNAGGPSRAGPAMRPADLLPFIVADVGHDKLFCEEFCAGADVHGEMHSRAGLGQEVRGNNECSRTHVGYSEHGVLGAP